MQSKDWIAIIHVHVHTIQCNTVEIKTLHKISDKMLLVIIT